MKLNHLIAATALAALASGSALAQGGTPSPGGAADSAQSAVSGAKDKAQDQKGKTGSGSKDMKGTPNNPITVTPPSQDDPNARVKVDTDPADANAAAGQSGVSADANLRGPNTTAKNGKQPVKPITDKLKNKKNSDGNSDNK